MQFGDFQEFFNVKFRHAMNAWAKVKAIDFADWIFVNNYIQTASGWFENDSHGEVGNLITDTTEKLYEMYLESI